MNYFFVVKKYLCILLINHFCQQNININFPSYVKAIINIKYNTFNYTQAHLQETLFFHQSPSFLFFHNLFTFVPSAIFIIFHRPDDLIYLIRKYYFASLSSSHSIHICMNLLLVWLSSDFSI